MNDPQPLRVLIADDEPWARRRLTSLLRTEPDCAIVAECDSGERTRRQILDAAPDVAFLDIQMGDMTGIDVIESLPQQRWPLIVFVTAYDQYAVHAFELGAVDYLLKPFDAARLTASLTRLRSGLARRSDRADAVGRVVANGGVGGRVLKRVAVLHNGRATLIRIEDVDWIQAAGNYAALRVGQTTHMLRVSLSALEAKLDPECFVRVHRSTIVNIDRIKGVEPWSRGEQMLTLADGTQLTIGRRYRLRLSASIGRSSPRYG